MSYTTALKNPTDYDDCLIASSLKKLFGGFTKTKSEPHFVIYNHINEVKIDLQQLNKKDITELSFAYLAAIEQSLPDVAFRYVVVYKENTPVVFCYFQIYNISSQNFKLQKSKSFVKGIIHFFINLKKVKVLITGNALRNATQSFCFDKNFLNKEQATEILASVSEKIAAVENISAIILKDITVTPALNHWLINLGFQTPWEDKVMELSIDPKWTSLESYVSSLTRKYKTRANKILTASNNLTFKQLSDSEIVFYNNDINRLFNSVIDSQSFFLTRQSDNLFIELKNIYKNNFEVQGIFLGQNLVGFSTAIITNDAYECYYIGYDSQMNNDHQLYFNILFNSLQRTILLKKNKLMLGRTSFDAKASLGAKPVDLVYYIKTPSIPNLVIKWFSNYFSSLEDNHWKLRNPLKQ